MGGVPWIHITVRAGVILRGGDVVGAAHVGKVHAETVTQRFVNRRAGQAQVQSAIRIQQGCRGEFARDTALGVAHRPSVQDGERSRRGGQSQPQEAERGQENNARLDPIV